MKSYDGTPINGISAFTRLFSGRKRVKIVSDLLMKPGSARPCVQRLTTGCLATACLFMVSASPAVQAATISGDSQTIFRLKETADGKKPYPLYEYLNLSGERTWGQGSLNLEAGGWGRFELGDKSTDRRTDTALQHGYLGYRGDKGNLFFQAGRQFIAEGVATERLDGLYVRSDLQSALTAAAFVGAPVDRETDFQGGDTIYGGRVAHSRPQYYTIGFSALRTSKDNNRIREEEGIDLWFHPSEKLDVVGRSSYNSLTSGWMEHDYSLKYAPLDTLSLNASLSGINYRDYFHQVTTKVFSLTTGVLDPREKVTSLGGSISYLYLEDVNISADFKNYSYDIAGSANYYGSKVAFTLPFSILTGFAVHRMDGENSRLRFKEYRVFASKKLGKADLTVDLFDVRYDEPINDVSNTYSLAAAVGYEVSSQLRVAADIDYGKSVDLDRQVSALLRLTYFFDKEFSREGRSKSEK